MFQVPFQHGYSTRAFQHNGLESLGVKRSCRGCIVLDRVENTVRNMRNEHFMIPRLHDAYIIEGFRLPIAWSMMKANPYP